MTDREKQLYNKNYYKKNSPKILERAKSKRQPKDQSQSNVISLFKTRVKKVNDQQAQNPPLVPPPVAPITRRFRVSLGTAFLHLLAGANMYFLVTEAARFYGTLEGHGFSAYLKAGILEGAIFVFSSLLKPKDLVMGLLNSLMILLIYSYSVWTISGTVIRESFSDQAQVRFHEKTVLELESEISKKTALRDLYFQENRVTLGSKVDLAINALKTQINQSREFLAHAPNAAMIWNSLLTLILFRVLVMISNLFCLRELARRYRVKLKTS